MLASPLAPRDMIGRGVFVMVTVCSVLMALGWLRPRWPTRAQSVAFVVLGSACIAVSLDVSPDASTSLFGATAFAVLGAYAASFHGSGLLSLTLAVAAATIAVLVARVWNSDMALAIGSSILLVLVNVAAAVTCRVGVNLLLATEAEDDGPSIELLDRAGFYATAPAVLSLRDSSPGALFVLGVVTVDDYSLVTLMAGDESSALVQQQVTTALRQCFGPRAVVARVADAEFLVAGLAEAKVVPGVVGEVRSMVRDSPWRLTLSVGVMTTPLAPLQLRAPNEVLDETVTIAGMAMYDARRGGGDDARFVVNPPLAVLRAVTPPEV